MQKPFGWVYEVHCLVTGKSYIGVTKRSIKIRWKGHCDNALEANVDGKGRSALAAAIRKYGRDQFTITEIACAFDESGLLESETIIIAQNNTLSPAGYNLVSGGGGSLSPSALTRQRMRSAQLGKTQSPEHVEKRTRHQRGRIRDRNIVERCAAKQRGVKRKSWGNHTAESKAKMRASIAANTAARGYRYKPEYTARMGIRLLGTKQSEETKRKRTESRKQFMRSDAGVKYRNKLKSRPGFFSGKRHTPEAKAKMSLAAKARKRRHSASPTQLSFL